jgi:hypothetical protein
MAFDRPRAVLGLQPETIEGSALWVLPNTSGLNANHQAGDFARAFRALRTCLESHWTVARGSVCIDVAARKKTAAKRER